MLVTTKKIFCLLLCCNNICWIDLSTTFLWTAEFNFRPLWCILVMILPIGLQRDNAFQCTLINQFKCSNLCNSQLWKKNPTTFAFDGDLIPNTSLYQSLSSHRVLIVSLLLSWSISNVKVLGSCVLFVNLIAPLYITGRNVLRQDPLHTWHCVRQGMMTGGGRERNPHFKDHLVRVWTHPRSGKEFKWRTSITSS